MKIYTLLFLTLISLSDALAQTLWLKSGEFKVSADSTKLLEKIEVSSWPTFENYHFGYVRFMEYPSRTQWLSLEAQGINKLEYVSDGFFLIALHTEAVFEALNEFGIAAHCPPQPEFKFVSARHFVPSFAKAESNKVYLNIHPYSNINLEKVKAELSELDFEVISTNPLLGLVLVKALPSQIDSLCQLNFVHFIDWKYDEGLPENYTGRSSHRVNFISPESNNGIEFDGSGVHVMLNDDGAIGPHIDRQGRVPFQFWDLSDGDHGDHVSGTIAGAGNLNPKHAGMAPGADVYVYKAYPEYNGFDSIATHYYSKDIVISSTSYSDGCNAGYTSFSRTMDQQTHDLSSLMHVFSAGNSGASNCGYGAGASWGNITGGHKMGKNVITVANVDENDQIAGSSSRGPASDGRIKPDISAKGTSVISTIENNEYGTKSGTSMSCPGVSGTLAVLYEAYESTFGVWPESGLMKGIVLNSADDIGNAGPDFIHGWGRINARKAYEIISHQSFLIDSVSTSDSIQFIIPVPINTSKARFMLYWTDPEAAVSASIALVNDLDLSVEDPSNTWHQPWVLDHTPLATSLSLPATNGEDHLNNVEQVEFLNPISGNYTIKIRGNQVPEGPQRFYIVFWFEPLELKLTYPIGGEKFRPFSTEKITWDKQGATGNLSIEYSTNGGSSWNTISNNVAVTQGYFDWTVPNLATGNLKLRLNHNSISYTSDSISVMQTPTGFAVVYSCPDSIGLSWNVVNSATGYRVYKLGEKYMDQIGSSTTSEFTDFQSNPMSDLLWYSVATKGPDNAVGQRAVAFKKAPGVFNCPFQLDGSLASISPPSGTLFDCQFDQFSMSFIVKNESNDPIFNFTASAQLGDSLIAESFSTALSNGQSDTFQFISKFDSPSDLELIWVAIDIPSDGNPYNDTIRGVYHPQSAQLKEPIWTENFESFELCSTEPDCGNTGCELSNDWVNEANFLIDASDWRTNSGATPSEQTGPEFDHTLQNLQGKYLYVEASACDNSRVLLLSPCIDLTSGINPTLSFWFHMAGADMGSLAVDILDGSFWNENVWFIQGAQGSMWKNALVDLSAFNGKIINIRFRAQLGSGYRSDVAIDDIAVLHPPIANFSYIPYPGGVVAFTDLSAFADSMSFSLGDGGILDSIPSLYSYANQVGYTVRQIVWNDLGSDTFSLRINTLGVGANTENWSFIYPNPANDYIQIELTRPCEKIEILNGSGQLIKSVKSSHLEKIRVSVEDLKAGVYCISIDDQPSKKLIIIR